MEKINKLKKIKEQTKKEQQEQRRKLILEGQKKIETLSIHLQNHTKRNDKGTHINYKIHHLLHDPFTFVNAYAKISKNRRALTEGYNEDGTMKLFGLKNATKIADKIKVNKYKFKPVRRTWVSKPGKNKKRPIDVPTQQDRIVQEAIRGILEAIYEPEFKLWDGKTGKLASNYSRPGRSTWSAMDRLKKYSQRCTISIEGNIVSAFNNVDHDILLSILRKRIKDKKFLKLIKQLLKSGIMDRKVYEDNLKGTSQGGVASPLLFDIYMHGLDKFVYNEIISRIIFSGEKKAVKDSHATRAYKKVKFKKEQSYRRLQKAKHVFKEGPTPKNKTEVTLAKKDLNKWRNKVFSTTYGDPNRLNKKALYVRYVDDWVLTLTCTQAQAESYKAKIAEFLNTQLKMQLDDEKTKITRVSKGYKFLGFEVRMRTTGVKQRFVLQRKPNSTYTRYRKRTTSKQLTIEPDSDRILTRLKLNKFCNKDYQPRAKPGWLINDEFDIVEKYNQIFRGIYNYYLPCQRLTRLNRISYILQHSCARTLARKRNTTLRKTFRKYGKNLKIPTPLKTAKKDSVRTAEFFTLTDLRRIKPYIISTNQ